MVLAFVMVTTMLGASRLRGWLSLLLGLTLGFVGIDGLSGQARFTFGIPYLLDGIDPVIVAIGLFAVGETLWIASRGPAIEEVLPVRGSLVDDRRRNGRDRGSRGCAAPRSASRWARCPRAARSCRR